MVWLDSIRRGKRRNKQISERRRIIFSGTATRPGADVAAASGADARSNTATSAWTCARRARIATAFAGVRCRDRRTHRRRWNVRRFHLWRRIWRFHRRYSERFRLRHRCRIRSHAHEFQVLFPGARAVDSAASTARRPRTAPTKHRIMSEIRGSDDGRQNEKKDHCVYEQRRNDPFPLFFLLLPLLEGRVKRSYFTSLGVMPITFTPEPRATSIAQITSEYFTAGSPLTKMILSGRGSKISLSFFGRSAFVTGCVLTLKVLPGSTSRTICDGGGPELVLSGVGSGSCRKIALRDIGMTIMKMIKSTNSTSIIGVTLISFVRPVLGFP